MEESNDPDFIIDMMVENRSSGEVQEAGCLKLAKLTVNDDAENKAVVAKGGIEAVVKAMGAHALRGTLQEIGCLMLWMFAMLDENQAVVAAKGGIEAVVGAMRAHGSIADLQFKACLTLLSIAWSDPKLQSQVCSAGAIPLVEKALRAFPSEAKLQQNGKQLLGMLVLDPTPRLPHTEQHPPEVCCTLA